MILAKYKVPFLFTNNLYYLLAIKPVTYYKFKKKKDAKASFYLSLAMIKLSLHSFT
jgi:hypothetical protein